MYLHFSDKSVIIMWLLIKYYSNAVERRCHIWLSAKFAERALLSVSRYPTLTDVPTERSNQMSRR